MPADMTIEKTGTAPENETGTNIVLVTGAVVNHLTDVYA